MPVSRLLKDLELRTAQLANWFCFTRKRRAQRLGIKSHRAFAIADKYFLIINFHMLLSDRRYLFPLK